MDRESKYFTLSLESLRAIGGWAADCAERALSVYETRAASDTRPRAAIEGIRVFAGGGKRTAQLRSLALEAHAAAREVGDRLLQLPPLAPPARRRRAPTRIPWRMSIRQSTLSVLRPMPHWRLSSTTVATRVSVTLKSAGRSRTPPLKYARSCCRCPLVKRARVGWIRSSTSWMRVSAVRPCRRTPNITF